MTIKEFILDLFRTFPQWLVCAAEIDMQEAQIRNFRWEIISILVSAFLWYAFLLTYIEHQSDKRLKRIEKLLLENESVPVGYVKLQAVDECDIKV